MDTVQHVVGISEKCVSNRREDKLITYSLGSCVGLSLYDPVEGIGGLVHCMLPLSKIDMVKAKERPEMFVDCGVPTLIQALLDLGAKKKDLVACVAGASRLLDDNGMFKIGERNYTVLRKVLWKNNILIAAEDIGGSIARTMWIDMDTGKTTLKSGSKEWELS